MVGKVREKGGVEGGGKGRRGKGEERKGGGEERGGRRGRRKAQ